MNFCFFLVIDIYFLLKHFCAMCQGEIVKSMSVSFIIVGLEFDHASEHIFLVYYNHASCFVQPSSPLFCATTLYTRLFCDSNNSNYLFDT